MLTGMNLMYHFLLVYMLKEFMLQNLLGAFSGGDD